MTTWTRPVALIAGATLVTNVAMIALGMGPNLLVTSALFGLIGVAVWTLAEVADVTPATAPIDATTRPAPVARSERRVTRLRTGLASGGPDGPVFEQLRETLVEVIDDQLRAAHQLDRSTDPEGARAVLGPELQTFIDDGASAASDLARPRHLDRVLTLIERL